MNFAQLIGYHTKTYHTQRGFVKEYHNIPNEHWQRIKEASQILARKKIGPEILYLDNATTKIEYRCVTPIRRLSVMSFHKADIIRQTRQLVTDLHEIGYGHGDLHIDNLGFLDDKVYLLDHDTLYRLDDKISPWLATWISEGYGWDLSSNQDAEIISNFAQLDYIAWQSDELDDE